MKPNPSISGRFLERICGEAVADPGASSLGIGRNWFPLFDPNVPQAATKVMWNFSYRPEYTDDADLREVEIASFSAASNGPIEHFRIGHVSFYFDIERTEGLRRSSAIRHSR